MAPTLMRYLGLLVACIVLASCSAPNAPESASSVRQDLGPDDERRKAEHSTEGLRVAAGLEVELFASEPMVVNPTNIDVDARGRIWVCEGRNYRPQLNPYNPTLEEGDRITILEDTDGDGKADSEKVFYQGNDVNAALGIAVFGDKIFVSASPNIIMFTDSDGDDIPDSKEIIFTGIGGEQHDHAVHAFVFGPDGKIYFNAGNAVDRVLRADGSPVVDVFGREVVTDGSPYREGLAFRMDPDGSNFEVLGHNFRNNYELGVDAYGAVWQSDNDDDGNRAVRINFVMEGGNYGFKDEMTGAGWRVPRTGMSDEIPLRHWHLNDPGVVPNLLQTGAGSPTGLTIYEGTLLPEIFQNQIIHTDAGPNVVRAYPVQDDGAGYSATMEPILENDFDQWFRPSDVAVAPDGSLIVADWYDPGVGGHLVVDLEKGRLFRVAPPNVAHSVPPMDLESTEGAIQAMLSPNMARRYLGWNAVREMGASAEAELKATWESTNSRHRARALWLLAKLDNGADYIRAALEDPDKDIRMTGLRAARQSNADIIPHLTALAGDPSPQVRREVAVSLRSIPENDARDIWTALALQHDGTDRWYLEALGIAADGRWESFLPDWMEKQGTEWDDPGGRDIVWRSRSAQTYPLLVQMLLQAGDEAARNRYFRAFDFQGTEGRAAALDALLKTDHPDKEEITTLGLMHLLTPDAPRPGRVSDALEASLTNAAGSQRYLDLISRFNLKPDHSVLTAMSFDNPDADYARGALAMLINDGGQEAVTTRISGNPDLISSLEGITDQGVFRLLEDLLQDDDPKPNQHRLAAQALASTGDGQVRMLEMVSTGKASPEAKASAASRLLGSWNTEVRQKAASVLGVPPPSDASTLPSMRELVASVGNPESGADVFKTHCQSCHVMHGEGTDYGPNLSEIGDKLSQNALFTSILFPDAGISFGYEGKMVTMKDGSAVAGYQASRDENTIALKVITGEIKTMALDDVEKVDGMTTSLMPVLHALMTKEELVDLVEYLHNQKRQDATAP